MIEPTDEMTDAASYAHQIGDGWASIVAEVLAIVERDQLPAKAGPGDPVCGHRGPDGRACQRRARHDVCLAWVRGGGADAWVTDYDGMASRIEALRAVLGKLVDPDHCYFDRHGGCQSHGFLSLEPGEKCPQARAKELLGRDKP